MPVDLDTSRIKEWRSIVTLIVFVLTNVVVLFPFNVPIYIPRRLSSAVLDTLSGLRVISPKQKRNQQSSEDDRHGKSKAFTKVVLPMNFITAPLIADLFLLAILAIGRQEVHDGTLGADHISPLDIMLFFLSLAYIAISIDASGLIRHLAFKVLEWGGDVGHRLFFYLYAFFFCLGSFIGNDPIILSGTAFLAYMTRVSSNIEHPRAWIHTQFAVANIASAILVSSNPTNLVLAGAFNIKFIHYTANMVVPVVVTAIVLFPFLLYIVFNDERYIPASIEIHRLADAVKAKKAINPNIPHARDNLEDLEQDCAQDEQTKLLSLEEIINPFLDKWGAAFGAIMMATTLITLLALNAANQIHQVFWVTLPAAVVMFLWDVAFGWRKRHETRKYARDARRKAEQARAERTTGKDEKHASPEYDRGLPISQYGSTEMRNIAPGARAPSQHSEGGTTSDVDPEHELIRSMESTDTRGRPSLGHVQPPTPSILPSEKGAGMSSVSNLPLDLSASVLVSEPDELNNCQSLHNAISGEDLHCKDPTTLMSLSGDAYLWLQETFPTATAVLAHLPFALVPFALAMFVLVQALVTKGWVPVFAYGWDHWVDKTGTVGSIGGMGFLSVVLCNFAGTNIGTTILLSRIIQAWQQIHIVSGTPISDRTFWATVYSMALGVNYGAFSAAFSASLAGLLWRDILARKYIKVHRLEFARVNIPIIAIAMTVGCVVLIGEVYIFRDDSPYHPKQP